MAPAAVLTHQVQQIEAELGVNVTTPDTPASRC